MKIFTVTLNGKDYEVQQDDDGVFSLPESLTHIVGVGTQLKPAIEPIILAQKPLDGTVANNVLAYGVGGLNIDACRVGISDEDRAVVDKRSGVSEKRNSMFGVGQRVEDGVWKSEPAGRFPANVLLDEHAAKEMDKQSGVLKDRGNKSESKSTYSG